MPAAVNGNHPHVSRCVQRPVKKIWQVIEALGLQADAYINNTPHYGRRAVEAIEDVFDSAEVSPMNDTFPILMAAAPVEIIEAIEAILSTGRIPRFNISPAYNGGPLKVNATRCRSL